MDKLKDHIDDPIKKCVVGLNLLGFKTAMSCCGFTYKDEKVTKEHLGKAYVYIVNDLTPDLSKLLIELSTYSGWTIRGMNKFIDFYADEWPANHPWNKQNCPHYYEKFLIGIQNLERVIDLYKDKMKVLAIINDGNNIYKNELKFKYWQYEPTESWTVYKEDYSQL